MNIISSVQPEEKEPTALENAAKVLGILQSIGSVGNTFGGFFKPNKENLFEALGKKPVGTDLETQ
jgi:hypothetical protein